MPALIPQFIECVADLLQPTAFGVCRSASGGVWVRLYSTLGTSTHFRSRRCFEALPVRDGEQLGLREQLSRQRHLIDPPLLDQHGRRARDDLIEAAMPEDKPHDQVIYSEQSKRADQPAGHRIVIADDRVLHGVGKRSKHNQVERVKLRQLPLAEMRKAATRKT